MADLWGSQAMPRFPRQRVSPQPRYRHRDGPSQARQGDRRQQRCGSLWNYRRDDRVARRVVGRFWGRRSARSFGDCRHHQGVPPQRPLRASRRPTPFPRVQRRVHLQQEVDSLLPCEPVQMELRLTPTQFALLPQLMTPLGRPV